nr:glycyl-radical enzyme activating protein [uncultured Blautia sp.]
MKQKLLVSQIQNFSLHDGPGIRTTVFLQGCNLRCKWCHNPETWKKKSILSYTENKCIGCGQCIEVCPSGAQQIQNGQHIYERTLCTVCGKCVEICCTEALEIVGNDYSVEELSELLLRDRRLYEISEGGVTFSGGEPMMQAEILYDLCSRLQEEHISVAFETALAFPWKVIHRMTECVDLFLVDFKIFDNEKHKEYTGTENTLIKENLKKLANYRPIMIRLPIIKGINDEIENAVVTADFLAVLGKNIKSVELLPYHDFGVEKAKHVGVNQQMFEAPDEKQLEQLKEVYRSRKINVVE